MALARIRGQLRHAPAFVNRHPDDDARVVIVALDGRLLLGGQATYGRIAESVGIGHLTPHEQPQPVSPVQIARVFDPSGVCARR